jgi:hypothetical protein
MGHVDRVGGDGSAPVRPVFDELGPVPDGRVGPVVDHGADGGWQLETASVSEDGDWRVEPAWSRTAEPGAERGWASGPGAETGWSSPSAAVDRGWLAEPGTAVQGDSGWRSEERGGSGGWRSEPVAGAASGSWDQAGRTGRRRRDENLAQFGAAADVLTYRPRTLEPPPATSTAAHWTKPEPAAPGGELTGGGWTSPGGESAGGGWTSPGGESAGGGWTSPGGESADDGWGSPGRIEPTSLATWRERRDLPGLPEGAQRLEFGDGPDRWDSRHDGSGPAGQRDRADRRRRSDRRSRRRADGRQDRRSGGDGYQEAPDQAGAVGDYEYGNGVGSAGPGRRLRAVEPDYGWTDSR